MDEKKGIRYSTRGIVLFLIIMAVVTIALTNLLKLDNIIGRSGYNMVGDWRLYNLISNSTYDISSREESDFFKYYIRSEKIINYPMTADYKNKNYGVVAQKVDGSYDYFNSYEEFKEVAGYNYYVKNNMDNLEEPEVGVKYLTNDKIFIEEYGKDFKFDPQNIEFKDNYLTLKGTWNKESLKAEIDNIPQGTSQEIGDQFIDAINNVYSEINPRENGLFNMSFAYSIDASAPGFISIMERENFSRGYFPKYIIFTLIALALVFVLGLLSDYEKIAYVDFYKSIAKFPVEVVYLLCGILFIPALVTADGLYLEGYQEFFRTALVLYQFALVFFGGIAVLYATYGLKSIYNRGFNSFVIRNSILGRVLSWFFGHAYRIISKFVGAMEVTSSKYALTVYGGLIFIGFLGTRWFVYHGQQNLIFVLWVILISGMAYLLKKYYEDIKAIESASGFLAQGYYDVKLDEASNNFKTLVHNLNTVSENLDSAVEEAIKSERLKTELITNVSHDLKTPLTSIINYSELIVDEENMEEMKEYARVINEKSHRLKELIEGLFDLSKVSSKNIDLNMESIDLGQLLEQIYGEWEDKLQEKGIVALLNKPEEGIIIELDGTQTSRILENLFSNISKYALENTRVYVDLIDKVDAVELIIKNVSKYPLNISPEELMERFTRGDASRSTEGSGLGLSIAGSLTELQGGSFKIEIDGDLFKTIIYFPR